jgi:glucose-1-phosphate thymidylyltransferase
MAAGIREILIISTPARPAALPEAARRRKKRIWVCEFTYAEQAVPNGLAQAFVIGRDFVGKDRGLILGDNIFYGSGLGTRKLMEHTRSPTAASCSRTT